MAKKLKFNILDVCRLTAGFKKSIIINASMPTDLLSLSPPLIAVVPGNQCHEDKEDIFSNKSQEQDTFAASKIQLTVTDGSGTSGHLGSVRFES